MHIAVGKQRIESLYRTDSGEIELKEQMIKNNEAKAGTSKKIKIMYSLDYIVQLINRKAKIPFIEGFLNG